MLFAATAERRSRPALADAARSRTWLRGAVGTALAHARRRPPIATLAAITAILGTFVRLDPGGTLPLLANDQFAYSPRGLVQGQYLTLLTSALMTKDPFMLISISISLLATLGTYEVMAGHVRAAALATVAVVLGPVLVTVGLGILVAAGSTWADTRLGTLDIGASAVIAAASGAVAALVHDKRFTTGLVLFLGVGGVLIHHRIADWEHVLIFPVGYILGGLMRTHSPRTALRYRTLRYILSGVALALLTILASQAVVPSPSAVRSASGVVVSPPRLVDARYVSAALGGAHRQVLVYLPAGYDHSRTRYPVVEFLHGYPGKPDDFFTYAKLQNITTDPHIAPFIAVIPDGNGPRLDDSWFANTALQKMGTAASADLRAWAGRHLRTTTSWSYAGLSSGGYAAAYLPMIDRRPVHAVCALSGFYDAAVIHPFKTAPPVIQRAASPLFHITTRTPFTFLARGLSDRRTTRTTTPYYSALRHAGTRVVQHLYPGTHSWTVWRPAFRDCLRLILPTHP